ncbi:MAG TPA: DUF4388 domain-containing protein, partial [Nannocystaceae bacterium]|nr:DUF4388 domain-containing protein [Nannocystaceae bacterium]
DALALALWRRVHARREDFEVQLARDAEALVRRVDAVRPAAVVVEVADLLPARRAFLQELRARDPAPRVLVLVREGAVIGDDELLAEGVDAIARAPVDVVSLIELLELVTLAEETMRGSLAGIGLLDLVQMLCLARRDGVVRVATEDEHGAIWLEQGEIVHAVWGERAGMDALVQLTTLDGGAFRVFGAGVVPARTIADGWRHALMNAACLADERRAHADEPDIAPVTELPQRPWQQRYRELTELGLAAMRGGDLAGARRHWNEARQLQESHGSEPAPRVQGIPASA